MKSNFKVDDILASKEGCVRIITEVCSGYYTWQDPLCPDREFYSCNSSDPEFVYGWEKLDFENLQVRNLYRAYLEERKSAMLAIKRVRDLGDDSDIL
jgi:hypothetical protein